MEPMLRGLVDTLPGLDGRGTPMELWNISTGVGATTRVSARKSSAAMGGRRPSIPKICRAWIDTWQAVTRGP